MIVPVLAIQFVLVIPWAICVVKAFRTEGDPMPWVYAYNGLALAIALTALLMTP